MLVTWTGNLARRPETPSFPTPTGQKGNQRQSRATKFATQAFIARQQVAAALAHLSIHWRMVGARLPHLCVHQCVVSHNSCLCVGPAVGPPACLWVFLHDSPPSSMHRASSGSDPHLWQSSSGTLGLAQTRPAPRHSQPVPPASTKMGIARFENIL